MRCFLIWTFETYALIERSELAMVKVRLHITMGPRDYYIYKTIFISCINNTYVMEL